MPAMVHLRVSYSRSADLQRDLDKELARGVLLVKVEPPPGLEFRAAVTLEIVGPAGASARFDGEVVSLLPGVGVAVAVPQARLGEVRAMVGAIDPAGAPAPKHEVVGAAPPAASPKEADGEVGTADKIRLALHGSRDDRAAILRDKNRSLHAYVLRNPNVSIEELAGYARNAQMSAEFLKLIAERKEWLSRPAIASALAKNPKTPPEIAVRALDYVPAEALRQMAKGIGAPPHVVQAARKKVIAP